MNTFEKHTQNYIKERSNPLRAELIEKKQDDINNNLSVAIAVVVMIAVCAGIYKVVSLIEVAQLIK